MNIYISLTSIYDNQQALCDTLFSIQQQSILPTKCYLFLSQEPYLLDKGFKNKNISDELTSILKDDLFVVEWVLNTGPFRKLLPLLEQKITEDCIIITIDDDTFYHKDTIKNYLSEYQKYKCVIASRSFALKFDNIEDISYHNRQHTINPYLYNFHTGKGAVLYHSSFFDKSKKHLFDSEIYQECCPFGDDIWFNFHRIANKVKCFIPDFTSYTKDLTTRFGLYNNINNKQDNNTKYMKLTIKTLQKLGYEI